MLHYLQPSEARRLTDVLRAGSESSHRYSQRSEMEERAATLQLVLEGGVLRQRYLSDGRRHTVAVYYRDDVINLCRYIGGRDRDADTLVALQGSVVGYVPDDGVRKMRAAAPDGQDGMAVLAYRELGIAQERLVSLGQRSAIEAMAHFFCETLIRCAMQSADYKVDRCSLHMTQELLSSVIGISAVHVNRVLQELRRLKLADVVRSELIVHDFDALARLGDFDDAYLAPL